MCREIGIKLGEFLNATDDDDTAPVLLLFVFLGVAEDVRANCTRRSIF